MGATPLTADLATLVDRLAAHRQLAGAPREELTWLATNGEFRRYEPGDVVNRAGERADAMIIMFSGRIAVRHGQVAMRHIEESRGGSVSGLLPYSRLTSPPTDVLAQEPTEALLIHRDRLPEMIRSCPVTTERLVHLMLDRARRFTTIDLEDARLLSLGQLAAGLAHELNNPAAAAANGARRLGQALIEGSEAAQVLGTLHLSDHEREQVTALVRRCLTTRDGGASSPLERADVEERLTSWLDARGMDVDLAASLAEGGIDTPVLDQLAQALGGDKLHAALRWIAIAVAGQMVAADVERATRRIHELVSAVRGFSYLDRAAVPEPVDIARGLSDTVAVLGAKARAKAATVQVEVPPHLPTVTAVGVELNQVWSSLIDNALDAVKAGGQVLVRAASEGDAIVVRVIDDGPGIPADIQPRIFDPFFTTKPVGQGAGLGLDVARRIVHAHRGTITFQTRPGRTEFAVRLPLPER